MKYRRFLRLRPHSVEDVVREIDDEIEAHIALRVEEMVARGETPERARAEALRRFGDVRGARKDLIADAKQKRRRARWSEWLDGVRQDIAYAFRRMRHTPGYALFSIATFGLAIGLTTATFTLVNGVLLRALPFRDADRLIALFSQDSLGQEVSVVSSANWLDWKEQSQSLEASGLYRTFRISAVIGAEAVRVDVTEALGDFLPALAPRMLLGRTFGEREAQAGEPVVVVSESFWRARLSADSSLSQRVVIAGAARSVIGVVPRGEEFPARTEIWLPTRYRREVGAARNWVNYSAIGRVRTGRSVLQADQELDAIANRIRAQDPVGLYSHGVIVKPFKQWLVGGAARYLNLLLGAVAFVLLIACSNLAGANLARGTTRVREMAVRSALGAGRMRLMRQLLAEQVVLATVGGALGVALAWWSVRSVLVLTDSVLPRSGEIRLDQRVLGFALLVSIAAGVLTGILPALQLSRSALRDRLGTRGAVRGGRNTPGAVLVGIEVALALVLLTGSMLLIRSYRMLVGRDLGFDTSNVVTAEIALARARFDANPERMMRYWEDLLPELRTIPGVEAVGAANWIPLGRGGKTFIEVEGNSAPNTGADYRAITEDYLRALGVRLQAGRDLLPSDGFGRPRVVLINRRMAEAFWPGQDPLGKRVRANGMESPPSGEPAPWLTVVGVVSDMRHWGLITDMAPEIYVGVRQVPYQSQAMTAVLRVRGPTGPVIAAAREGIHAVDAETPGDVGLLHDALDRTLRERHLIMGVLTVFGAIALLLAAMGLYSLLSFSVSQRTREIAVRAALGARSDDLMRMMFVNAMSIVVVGAAVGLASAFALTRLMTDLLVDVSPADPISFASVTVFLLATGMVAALVPAMRAARLDPMVALQGE